MEKAKKRIRVVLLCAVITAAFVGILYYYYNVRGGVDMAEGTLIAGMQNSLARVEAHVFR